MIVEIEVNSCQTCPALRNDEYGLHCFYNDCLYITNEVCFGEIHSDCPLLKNKLID